MPNGFKATKDKSKTKTQDLISNIKSKEKVTNEELAQLIITLIEKLDTKLG